MSKKEEKSLFDEVWDAAGLTDKNAAPVPAEEAPAPAEVAEEIAPAEEAPAPAEGAKEISPAEEAPAPAEVAEEISPAEEAPAPAEVAEEIAPAEEATPAEKAPVSEHTEKKKSIKFLVIYTVVFVVVITALIGGSYMVTSRIHKEMSESSEDLGNSQSTLQNIQNKNEKLNKENAALTEKNEALEQSQLESDELIADVGDMVEHNEYLAAAMNAYIDGERADARTILSTVDREKLSPTFRAYYDLLTDKLD